MTAEPSVRLPNGTMTSATGWVAEPVPVPNEPGRLRIAVSRPDIPGRYRLIRRRDDGFPVAAAVPLIERVADNGGLADIVASRFRNAANPDDDDGDGRDDDIIRRTLRRHNRPNPAGTQPEIPGYGNPTGRNNGTSTRHIREQRRGR